MSRLLCQLSYLAMHREEWKRESRWQKVYIGLAVL